MRPTLTFSAVLILLPPSEGKAAPRRGKPFDEAALCFPVLTGARKAVRETLIDLCTNDPDRAAEVLVYATETYLHRHVACDGVSPPQAVEALAPVWIRTLYPSG